MLQLVLLLQGVFVHPDSAIPFTQGVVPLPKRRVSLMSNLVPFSNQRIQLLQFFLHPLDLPLPLHRIPFQGFHPLNGLRCPKLLVPQRSPHIPQLSLQRPPLSAQRRDLPGQPRYLFLQLCAPFPF
ncbi:hypothetical protein BDV93DRAFT_522964 [Ceratobasidium sp. AG-I]|nr:hypothetical protein BDV93DRAFT_522964 [Ceratobasidium sp. AG-I]